MNGALYLYGVVILNKKGEIRGDIVECERFIPFPLYAPEDRTALVCEGN